jgi:hypothetical protein
MGVLDLLKGKKVKILTDAKVEVELIIDEVTYSVKFTNGYTKVTYSVKFTNGYTKVYSSINDIEIL